MAVRYIADKSALARMRHPTVEARLRPLVVAGEVGTCGVVDLEVLYSARSYRDVVDLRRERRALPQLDVRQVDFDRAADVVEALARSGHHRAAGLPDLLIAAIAERHAVCVLHYDADFEVIGRATGQPTEWVVPAGSVP